MRKILFAGLAGLMLSGPVLADPPGWHDGRHDERRDDRRYDHRGDYRHDERYERGDRDIRWNGPRYQGYGYAHPRGYAERRWAIGYRLPPAYYGSRYWIERPAYYRLPPAYRGTRWVRVGSDALLINVIDGVIVQAVRGLYF